MGRIKTWSLVFSVLCIFTYLCFVEQAEAAGSVNSNASIDSEEKAVKSESVDKWECLVCKYVYDPNSGDVKSKIEPGTKFEDLPEDWVCPICGASKDKFKKIETQQTGPVQTENQD